MLKHIVFIKLKGAYSDTEKDEIINKLVMMLNNLKNRIDEIELLETGINFSKRAAAFDISLMVEVKDEDCLEKYRVHPKHQEVLQYMRTLKLETAVVDYIKE